MVFVLGNMLAAAYFPKPQKNVLPNRQKDDIMGRGSMGFGIGGVFSSLMYTEYNKKAGILEDGC